MVRASPAARVLGIDPGTINLGWAVVAARAERLVPLGHGVVQADPRAALGERLATIAGGLRAVIASLEPTEAAIEEAFHGRNARAALALGAGRGAALLVLAESGLPVVGYANNVVKRAVTGAGRASKERMRDFLVRLLGLERAPETLDASDALGLAVCHLQRRGRGSEAGSRLPPRLEEAIRRARARG
jgi:crossover junction endodeoxyribonuclease RuvC